MHRFVVIQAKKGLDFLIDRREFWSQQRPDYPKGPREKIGKAAGWNTVMSRLMPDKRKVFGRHVV